MKDRRTSRTHRLEDDSYRAIIEAAPIPIMALRKGRFLFVNRAGAGMLGYGEPEEMVGASVYDIVPRESRQIIEERMRRLESGRGNPLAEVALVGKDGTPITVESTSVAVTFGGEPAGVVIARDVTDLKRTERSLQKEFEFQQLITDLTSSLIGSSSASLDEVVNNSLASITAFMGIDRAFVFLFEDEGRKLYNRYLWPADRPLVPGEETPINFTEKFPWVANQLHEGRIILGSDGFGRSGMPDDLRKWLEDGGITSGAVIPMIVAEESVGGLGMDTTGPPHTFSDKPLQHLSILANILGLTIQRVRKHRGLVESEERFRTFMDHNPAISFMKDGDLRHIYGNAELLRTFNLSPEEFIGTTNSDFFPPEITDAVEDVDRKILSGEIDTFGHDYSAVIQGEERWFYEVKFLLTGHDGKPLVGGMAFDISDRKKGETELREAFEENQALKDRLEKENIMLRDEMELTQAHSEIVGRSHQMKAVLSQVEQVAATGSTVLIIGETGTGKELIARQVHALSDRGKKQLVKVNCAALPPTLIESELFGREKGAFTGAMAKQVGRFEFADGGTIFLDEVGELPLDLQAKLLRVLQDGEFERLGSPQTHRVDVRIIAATNRELERSVHEGDFRGDLFYRLNIFPVRIPPLRERKEDIPPLAWYFVQQFWESMGKAPLQISRHTMKKLMEYTWPGNAREMRNVLERGVILSKGPKLEVELPRQAGQEQSSMMTLREFERRHILDALSITGGKVFGESGAARILGINPKTLYSRMGKLGISRREREAETPGKE